MSKRNRHKRCSTCIFFEDLDRYEDLTVDAICHSPRSPYYYKVPESNNTCKFHEKDTGNH